MTHVVRFCLLEDPYLLTNFYDSSVRKGDILCFKNSGAYGFTMTSNYNSRLKPSEVCIYENKILEIRKREEFDDLLNKQIDIFKD